MSKYEEAINEQAIDIESVITEGEQIIWKGKPKKSAFIVNKIVNMLPFTLIWLPFDGFIIFSILSSGETGSLGFILPFFAFHLLPVWIWLGNVLTAKKRWDNTQYAVTNRRIIVQSGFIGLDYKSIYYKDISNVHLNVGTVDKLLKVGDIYFDTHILFGNIRINNNNSSHAQAFLDIENPYELYPKLQKIVLDIQTDVEYPNDLRPKSNKGYNTEYDGKF